MGEGGIRLSLVFERKIEEKMSVFKAHLLKVITCSTNLYCVDFSSSLAFTKPLRETCVCVHIYLLFIYVLVPPHGDVMNAKSRRVIKKATSEI